MGHPHPRLQVRFEAPPVHVSLMGWTESDAYTPGIIREGQPVIRRVLDAPPSSRVEPAWAHGGACR